MSDPKGINDQDPAERLAVALRRIAVAVERREAAAATQPPPPAFSQPTFQQAVSMPAVAGNLDALIARLRAVLDEMSPRRGSEGGGVSEDGRDEDRS